ncbi:interleukin-1 receptor accessory protein isoform X1 [Ornithorhynchus anatinus]|uniref:Interleukin-1 receptor accessory protein n=1 Tax=Ornithorhynchus anatinus TaxID=9258 RepID=A0A6I8MYP4_ORNAN|nr:interleukin-1 receptor accessory protein isoform X1 [Ornithorhynchus anatinus]
MDLFCFLVTFWLCVTLQSGSSERCEDWGLDTMTKIQVYDGEPACIKCPLFEQFLKYNYSTAHSAGLTLIWYWIGQDRDLEEPINFRLPDNRISKEKDILWFRPTLLNDTGNYTCMLRNTTYCSKVAFPLEVVRKDPGKCVSPLVKPLVKLLYEEEDLQFINCPNIDGFYPVNLKPVVHWFKGCKEVNNFHSVFPNGTSLDFTTARSSINGIYTCIVNYLDGGRTFSLTRSVEVKVVGHPDKALPPQMLSPMDQVVYEKEPGEELLLPCEVIFTFLKDSPKEIWWTIDGKKTDDIPDITVNQSIITSQIEDITIKKTLNIKKVSSDDLKRNYTCHARNAKGKVEKQAKVKQKVLVPRYTVELACGFGATVFLVVILIVVYHVYWLEMVLFYRAHFGTDETILDGKEYDIYVSYARNAEEEEFVLLTLRGVLENEFGYKLCIFDRDSLPGGNTVEAVFDFIQRSRRMIVVLSPDYVTEKSISMLEFKLGVMCQNSIATQLIVVEYQPLQHPHPGVLQLKESVPFISWKGEKSNKPGSQFWKALRLALPLRSLNAGSGWNDSCSSQSDLSLDHIQRRRSRLKAPSERQDSKSGLSTVPTPMARAKHRAKPSSACRCCVTYCGGQSQLRSKSRAEVQVQPQWETHLCKPVPRHSETHWIQNGNKAEVPAPQISSLALHHFTDLSNNNDFYVL